MSHFPLKAAQNMTQTGQLKISVTSDVAPIPITNATINITLTGNPDVTLEVTNTN